MEKRGGGGGLVNAIHQASKTSAELKVTDENWKLNILLRRSADLYLITINKMEVKKERE